MHNDKLSMNIRIEFERKIQYETEDIEFNRTVTKLIELFTSEKQVALTKVC